MCLLSCLSRTVHHILISISVWIILEFISRFLDEHWLWVLGQDFRNFPEPECTEFAFMELMVCEEFTYLSIHMPSSLCSFHIGLSFSQMLSSFVLYSFQITKEWCRVIACYGNAIFSSDIWLKKGNANHQGHKFWGEVRGWTSGKDTLVLKRNGNKGVSFCFWCQQWGSKHATPELGALAY